MTPVRIHTPSPRLTKSELIAAADWVLIELRLSVKVIRLRFIFRLGEPAKPPSIFHDPS